MKNNDQEIYLYFKEERTTNSENNKFLADDYRLSSINTCFKGLYKQKQVFNDFTHCKHFLVPKQALNEKGLYIIYVSYSDGDTFSHTSGYIEFITCCKFVEDARKICDSIKNDTYDIKGQFLAWNGYFASCDSVEYQFFNFED